MKILFVVSANAPMPFVWEQAESLNNNSCQVDFFCVKGRGYLGYLSNYLALRRKASEGYNLIHAHFGLTGALAVLQRKIPVITTFHGSDTRGLRNRIISSFAAQFSAHCIFVNRIMVTKIISGAKYSVIPCGVDLGKFFPLRKSIAREKLMLSKNTNYVLFGSSFDNKIKNYKLAEAAFNCSKVEFEVLELKGRSRREVNLLLNACDLLLLTSISEGSPQIAKEAIACNTPILSTAVGDVPELIKNISGCRLVKAEPIDIGREIDLLLSNRVTPNGRNQAINFNIKSISNRVFEVYDKVLYC